MKHVVGEVRTTDGCGKHQRKAAIFWASIVHLPIVHGKLRSTWHVHDVKLYICETLSQPVFIGKKPFEQKIESHVIKKELRRDPQVVMEAMNQNPQVDCWVQGISSQNVPIILDLTG